jgi:hypothetical protein
VHETNVCYTGMIRSFVAHHVVGVIIPIQRVRLCVLLAVCNQCFSGVLAPTTRSLSVDERSRTSTPEGTGTSCQRGYHYATSTCADCWQVGSLPSPGATGCITHCTISKAEINGERTSYLVERKCYSPRTPCRIRTDADDALRVVPLPLG